jgi:hypothetical protein
MKRLFIVGILCSAIVATATDSQVAGRRKTHAKPHPCVNVRSITDCPDEGCGAQYDPALNRQKNIPWDNPAANQPTVLRSIAWMKSLPDPEHFTAKNRDRGELQALGEGQMITVVAWALAARKGGAESCNCKLKAKPDTDNHIVLVEPTIQDPTLEENEKRDSETAEFTPRVRRDKHLSFTQEKLEPLIDPEWRPGMTPKEGKLLVRVTGLLMFDSEHFLQHPLKRHNNWEIHPILKMEYCADGQTCDENSDANWKDLDFD